MTNSSLAVRAEDYAFTSLLSYAAMQNPSYEIAKHHALIASALEAVERGEIKRLMIFLPPRSGKTMLASEYFPAWYLGRNPTHQMIATTYSYDRANDVGRKVRNQIVDPMYQLIFPDSSIASDSQSANKFNMAQGGVYVSVGVGGAVVGRGAHCICKGTMIQTDHGPAEISELVDLFMDNQPLSVLSWNHSTNEYAFKNVLATSVSLNDTIYEIRTRNGKTIRTTGDHRFYVTSIGYLEARYLQYGDEFITFESDQIQSDTIAEIVWTCGCKVPVYDIQVEGTNNFFANEILVHNCFLIDDPIKSRRDAESESSRRIMRDWFQGVAYTRLMGDGAIIIILTRWHHYDLAGWLLKEKADENWHVLNIPAISVDPERDLLGRKEGETIWPENPLFHKSRLEQLKRTIGSREWNSQYQQNPLPSEEGLFNPDNFARYSYSELRECMDTTRGRLPFGIKRIVHSWDTAFKMEKVHDPTACTVWGISDSKYYLIHAFKKRYEFPDLIQAVVNTQKKFMSYNTGPVPVLIEDRGSGQSLIQSLERNTQIPVIKITDQSTTKYFRAEQCSEVIKAGKVVLPDKAPWLIDYETEMCQFPVGQHDDYVDSTSQFIKYESRPKYLPSKQALYWK
ncbi:MAG: phage terminase large subunit [Bacilli bacterium]|jgi:predicted phage terminase large subunit-like protein